MSLEENVNENVKPEISAEKNEEMVTAKIVKKGQNQPEDHSTEDRDVGKERQKL